MTVYIYILRDPRTNEIKWVGQSVRPQMRFNAHLSERWSNKGKTNWVQSLMSDGLLPVCEIIDACTAETANQKEADYICCNLLMPEIVF